MASLGHEVFISAFWGLTGASTEWNGHLVLPGGQDPYGSDIIVSHARYVKADLVITLMDVWPLDAGQVRSLRVDHGIPVAHWMPVDCDPLGAMDERHLKTTGAIPVAMSRYGESRLQEAGLDPLYVPHGIEATKTFTPERREEARKALGVDSRFVVAMNAANKDAVRKGFPEQMSAFARFRRRHPEAVLMLHSLAMAPGALDLQAIAGRAGYPLARAIEKTQQAEAREAEAQRAKAQAMVAKMGIMDAVKFADQYAYLTGLLRPEAMAAWMSAADVGLHCSYGEGFGLGALEFQACGRPVITTDATAMPELAGPGWRVSSQEFWNSAHAAWWAAPVISRTCPQCGHEEGIDAALEAAWQAQKDGLMPQIGEECRRFAVQYDADRVLTEHWKPALDAIMERAHSAPAGSAPQDAQRDAALARLEAAHAAGVLDAGEFGRRSHRAVKAETGGELAALLADLPAGQAAA